MMMKPRIYQLWPGHWRAERVIGHVAHVGDGYTPLDAWGYCVYGNDWDRPAVRSLVLELLTPRENRAGRTPATSEGKHP